MWLPVGIVQFNYVKKATDRRGGIVYHVHLFIVVQFFIFLFIIDVSFKLEYIAPSLCNTMLAASLFNYV